MKADSLTFQIERFADCAEETRALQAASWAETFARQGLWDLDADIAKRLEHDRLGDFVLCTARADGALVGVCAFVLKHSLMQSARYAQNDIIFLQPAHRHGKNARALWFGAVHELFRRDVRDVRMAVPLSAPVPFFESLGLAPRSINLGKTYTDEEVQHALGRT